jgi:hypothetical protein
LFSACTKAPSLTEIPLPEVGIRINVPPGFTALKQETIEKLAETADSGIAPFTVRPHYGFKNVEKNSFFVVSSAVPDSGERSAEPLENLYRYRKNFEETLGINAISDVESQENLTFLIMNVLIAQEEGDMLLTRGLYYLYPSEFAGSGAGRYVMIDLYLDQKNGNPEDIEGYKDLMFSIKAVEKAVE